MSISPPVLFEEIIGKEGRLGVATLNRPQVLNALNHEMVQLLQEQLLLWKEKPEIKAVLIRAVEGRAFCAGGDLKPVYEKKQDPEQALAFFEAEYRLNRTIYHYPKPYIALLDGITMGGGVGLSLHGSHRIATDKLIFAMPETAIGFFPDVGSSYFLARLPKKIGLYLALSSARLTVDDCLPLHLVDYKIQSQALPLLLQRLVDCPFKEDAKLSVTECLKPFAQKIQASELKTKSALIEEHFSKATVEECLSSLEQSSESWCQETAKILRLKSPTSLKVTQQQLERCRHLSFDQCMDLDDCLVRHFLQGPDFYEGIRAFVMDKDQKPRWQPIDLASLSKGSLEAFFKPLSA